MKLSPTQVALVKIAERRNAAVAGRDAEHRAGQFDQTREYWRLVGEIGGLDTALSLLREAGLPVNSAEYLAIREDAV